MGTYADYTYSGKVSYRYSLNSVSYSLRSYSTSDNTSSIDIEFKGIKTYDAEGSSNSRSVAIGWKLYDEDGVVVESGTVYTPSLLTGEGFKVTETIYFLPSGEYTLKILSTR